jgi:hypothetical protein
MPVFRCVSREPGMSTATVNYERRAVTLRIGAEKLRTVTGPVGGTGVSGMGMQYGRHGLDEFLRVMSVGIG